MAAGWQFWIDRGGTFTDIVALAPDGKVAVRKWLSENPELYPDAALHGISQILRESGTGRKDRIAAVKMGTTVGTNALLERKGAAIALVTNLGFRDCLRIGYQNRPDIFALRIRRPEPLYQAVAEIDVRVGADGRVLQELTEDQANAELRRLYDLGIRNLAVVLLHAWRYPQHELMLAELAADIGFEHISLSHLASPLPKFVARGDTAVVDAYLSPVLRRYVAQVERGLPTGDSTPSLLFMQSNGGLVRADAFHGKDSILSGPAGGVVGAIAAAKGAGLAKIIAFDMGGTSTDVAHYAGELERSFDNEVAGVRMRTPMMAIHTVAAGGGSILHFDGLRCRVGPDSAGANPGPACYRRGGPLTVTDANLLLGKLPDFPAVFGPKGNLPPDRERVTALFSALAAEVSAASGERRSPEQVAEGFLEIAVEHMAEAIKKISVQKGYPLADYALCCYGAAGAQHACLLAERLGMRKVLLHPLAGVLSAYGIGLAEFRVLKQAALEGLWQEVDAAELRRRFSDLEQAARRELAAQGLDPDQSISRWRLALRYQGSDTALTVDYAEPEAILQDFAAAYRRQFGFCYERPVVIASLQVESIACDSRFSEIAPTVADRHDGEAQDRTRLFSCGRWHDAPVYRRERLGCGQTVAGPAVILEPTSTIVVEPGWQALMQHNGDLLLSGNKYSIAAPSLAAGPDPVMLEIFNQRFMSVAEQMGFVLQNTAHSVNIKERLDFSCAVFDAGGNLIANAPHIPVHLGSMGESVKALVLSHGKDLAPGDAYLLNSPYAGGTHLPDITVVTPVFDAERQLLFFVASRGHHADVGGISPGSMPAASRHIDDEGVISAGLKILDAGRFQEAAILEWLAGNRHPARNPQQNLADLQAQIAANLKGTQELLAMVGDYSLAVVLAYMQHVQDHAEACVRRLLKTLDGGSFAYPLDQGGTIAVSVSIDRDTSSARIDFSATSPQLADNFNAPAAVCKAAVLYVMRTLVQDDIPLNAGCLKPLDIVIPEGCLLNPQYPAAVVAGNVETSQYIVDALFGALGVLAASQGTMNNLTFGDRDYQYYETICGGAGAGEGFAGTSGVHTHMTNSRITDPEILEQRFPVLLREFSLREGSGGDGRYRGGDGVRRRLEFWRPMTVAILSSHRCQPPFGMRGGWPGAPGVNRLLKAGGETVELAGCADIRVEAGDSIVIETPGGGGFGASDRSGN
ncbi:hydantoinase B/oxoprolinase family protein [Methylomonas koyamae]|uniref:hydantoinase B/oxoprolinase family protein n=1 Tax=Methylomonas koyamae TaxID=702114 RepID=UPI00112C0591|nr:hydantoinase B/oxoprolinase family protein [Methylomonas koyamae]TPQ24732.1 5-oxoprolinase [Methylomonas koyamae]